jgi:hypothetical protein
MVPLQDLMQDDPVEKAAKAQAQEDTPQNSAAHRSLLPDKAS